MQMGNGFAGVRAVVEYQPITALPQTKFLRHLSSFKHQVTEHLMIRRQRFGNAGNGLFGNQQDMDWGFWSNILKRQHEIILVNDGCRDFSGNDLLE